MGRISRAIWSPFRALRRGETVPRVEWHEDKDSLGWFFVPKGQEDSAQGFNPGNRISPAKSPEGAPDRTRNAIRQSYHDLSPLQGKSSYSMLPRVETLG